MSSPVTGNDLVVASGGEEFCVRITRLLSLVSKMKLWFDWAFTSGGDAQNAFKAAMLPPPGTVFAYYSTQNAATVKIDVEGWYRDPGDSGIPFYRLCDGTGGTPDLRGRVIVGVGQGSGLTDRTPGSSFGSETHLLTTSETPIRQHFHGFGENPGGDEARFINRSWSKPGTYNYIQHSGDSPNISGSIVGAGDFGTTEAIDSEVTPTNAANAHNNMQPSMALYYIIRTSRLA